MEHHHTTVAATPLVEALALLDEAAHRLRPTNAPLTDARAVALLLSYAAGLSIGMPSGVFLACLADQGVRVGEAQTTARAVVGLVDAAIAFCQDAEARHG